MNRLLPLWLVVLLMGGCAAQKARGPEPTNTEPVVLLEDGSRCVQPADFAALRSTPNASRFRELLESEGNYEEFVTRLKDLKFGYGEVDAVFFDSCKASQGKSLPKPTFERNRRLYLAARQTLLAAGIGSWLTKGSLGDAGKLCLFGFGDEAGDARNFTRLVPGDTSVDDCAQMSEKLGGNYVLLGCTAGKWENNWAKKSIKVGPWGAKNRRIILAKGEFTPKTNCAWY
jgi:hypothetical protein